MNHRNFREHRIPPRSDVPSSLGRFVGESRLTEAEIEDRVAKAYRDGVIVFTRAMLERLKPFDRAYVEGLAKNLCDGR